MKDDAATIVADLPATAIYQQEFTIRYDYPVYFTERVFDRDNPVFERRLVPSRTRQAASLRRLHRCQCRGGWPALAHEIAAYAQAHADTMEFVAPAEVVPAGRVRQERSDVVTRLQQRLV